MPFDSDNAIVKLCSQGMALEGEGKNEEARNIFYQAWNEAKNEMEKFIAAHYVARHQNSTEDKLKWDERALNAALTIEDKNMQSNFPSLYLNIAKCHEDLNNDELAEKNYRTALFYCNALPDTGYGNWIKSGILNGIERMDKRNKTI